MAESNGAPEGGDGAPEGDGKDKDFVPKTQFIAAINSATAKHDREMQALRAEMEAKLAEAKKPEKPRQYTRAEVTTMVDAGQITQEQADAQMDLQMREDARAEASRVANETVSAAQRKSYIETEINRYKAVEPSILDEASDTRARIVEEYKYLVEQLGDSNSLDTQLKAIRAVLGPVEKLERSRGAKPSHESHRETGGQGGGGKKSDDGKLTYEVLSPREKDYYDKKIASGLYKDIKAVNEELAYANPQTRRKYGAMN